MTSCSRRPTGCGRARTRPSALRACTRRACSAILGTSSDWPRNLGDNAAHHAAGRVDLSLATSDGHASLVVDDDGPGIPAAERDRVFERFVRLDEGRDRGEGGSGLGLAIAREVARAHGGEVSLADSPLGGLRAEVRLPTTQNTG